MSKCEHCSKGSQVLGPNLSQMELEGERGRFENYLPAVGTQKIVEST